MNAVIRFVSANPEDAKLANEAIGTADTGLVRFNRFFGKIVNVDVADFSFRVEAKKVDPRVVSFIDNSNRNMLKECSENSRPIEKYVDETIARDAAFEILKANGLDDVIEVLHQERSSLSCIGSEDYYQFVWREQYDENKVAMMLARVEVLVNPSNGRVFTLSSTFSAPNNPGLYSPDICMESIASSRLIEDSFEVIAIALFLDHKPEGESAPAWAVTLYKETDNLRDEQTIFIDAQSGEILQER